MKNKLFRSVLIGLLGFVFVLNAVIPAAAQAGTQATPTPTLEPTTVVDLTTTPAVDVTPEPTPTRVPGVLVTDPNVVSFVQLRSSELQLTGPQDASSIVFGVPADWRLIPEGRVDLSMGVSFNTQAGTSAEQTQTTGGTLTVLFNRKAIGSIALNQIGEVEHSFNIPADALVSARTDGRMDLSFVLDSGISCYVNQQLNVFIHLDSRVVLPHEIVAPDTSLARFPFPLYLDAIFPESALIVIPDQPSAAELQAAMTVGAGLGNLTGGSLALNLVTVGQLTETHKQTSHLVFVGKAAQLPLAGLTLPLAPDAAGQLATPNSDDGVVEMVSSVWNLSNVALLVTGNTDAGVVKAAQAVTTGVLRANSTSNLAIVAEVQPEPIPVSVPIDQTLYDLGYESKSLSRTSNSFFSNNLSTYRFYVPPGQTPTEEAYFELIFGHSALLNYNRSGAVIALNGQPIGSIRFSDIYAAQAMNAVKTSLPASEVLPGYNEISIKVDLVPTDICITKNIDSLWFTIWPDSNLHLPLNPSINNPGAVLDLSAYPAPFVFDPTLESLAFVLQRNDPASWASTLRIANYLGGRANGTLTNLSVFYGDDLPEAERATHHFVFIGRPSQLPALQEINARLPAPFETNDMAAEKNTQVQFRIPPTAPLGYVQMTTSPWSPDHIVMTAVGNTPQGVDWAAAALVDSNLRSRLAGNIAVVDATRMFTADTRFSPVIAPQIQTPSPTDAIAVPTNLDLTPPPVDRPAWIQPLLIASLTLMLVILLIVIVSSWLRNRSRRA